MNQFQKTFDDIVELTRAKPIGTAGSFSGLCPSHDDKSASLSITLENDRILLYCHTVCTIDDICLSLGIEQTDLFAPRDEKQINRTPASQKAESEHKRKKARINPKGLVVFFSSKHKKEVTESVRYSYFNAGGKTAYLVIRSDPKDFRPMTPDGYLDLEVVVRLPYRLPELLQGVKESKPILLLEGEKDVDRAVDMGLVATTFVGGTGKWRQEYLEYFDGADVVLIPDNDKPGLKGMTEIAKKLHGTASKIRMLELPGLGPRKEKHGKDFSDWIELEGNAKNTLEKIISELPEWLPEKNENKFEELNEKHFVTWIGGKTIVVNEVYDPAMERQILTYSSPTDFKNFYSNRFVPVEDRHVPMGTFWFKNPNRRQYKGLTFMPGESSPYQGHYNLWGGFSVDPKSSNSEIPTTLKPFHGSLITSTKTLQMGTPTPQHM